MSIYIVGLIAHHNSLFYAFVIIVGVTNDISQVLEALDCFECFISNSQIPSISPMFIGGCNHVFSFFFFHLFPFPVYSFPLLSPGTLQLVFSVSL